MATQYMLGLVQLMRKRIDFAGRFSCICSTLLTVNEAALGQNIFPYVRELSDSPPEYPQIQVLKMST